MQLNLWETIGTDTIVNVASVPHRSPFRYPGGKTWLVPRVRQWLNRLPIKPKIAIEPFAGGGIVGLTIAFEKLADTVILVERDEQVASVWETIINQKGGAKWLADQIVHFNLNMDTAEELLNSQPKSTREKAFMTIVQNRISHGGILADGAGLLKHGENGKGILSRWYPQTLRKRILEIEQIKEHLSFVKGDGFQIVQEYSDMPDVVFFVDPPYTASAKKAGTRLYKYHQIDHDGLFEKMSQVQGDFLMTYDHDSEVEALAAKYKFDTRLVAMSNTHHAKMKEMLIGRNLKWVS